MTPLGRGPVASELAAAVSPDIPSGAVVLVPVGSVEQHGPHLPLETDTLIAVATATAAAARLGPGHLVAPALTYGSSGEHQSFPGTVSIGQDALRLIVLELVRSVHTWAERTVLVNAHGGNVAALASAVRQLREEGHDVGWVPCLTEEVDLHAGRTETSLLLHIDPASVLLERAEAGNTEPLEAILPAMLSGGVAAVSANGVLGDPTGASDIEGAAVLAAMVEHVVDSVRRGSANDLGRIVPLAARA